MWCKGKITGKFSVTSRTSTPVPLLQVLISSRRLRPLPSLRATLGTVPPVLRFWRRRWRSAAGSWKYVSCIDLFPTTFSIEHIPCLKCSGSLRQSQDFKILQILQILHFLQRKKRLDLEIWPRTAGDGQWGAQRWPQLSKPVNQILTGFVTAVIYGYNGYGYSYSDIYLLYILFINVNH